MDISKFPQPPVCPVQMIGKPQGYTTNGRPTQIVIDQSPSQQGHGLLGANFSNLIGNQVTVPMAPISQQVITETTSSSKKRKKKSTSQESDSTELSVSDSNDVDKADPANAVESTVYAETYYDTNNMAYGIIYQTDELLRDCKQELDHIRAQKTLKGRYHYINATVASMSSLLTTKLAAIKEINSTIKAVNDNEYRRFKDMRAINQADDNKAIMDAYSAFISAPVGVPAYSLPGTTALTGGLNGIVRADYPAEVQAGMDAGMANYLANLTPEENLMLNDNNKDIEEVIVYDQASGARRFQWINTRTGEPVNNMPSSSELTLNDYNIDLRTGLAKNNNLNSIKKVVIMNGSSFNNL